jgi:DNA-binding MarR family transcriptional regulator
MPKSYLISKGKISPNAVQHSVSGLLQKGLVHEKEERSIRRAKIIDLTIFGRKAAEMLDQIEGQIGEAQKHVTVRAGQS